MDDLKENNIRIEDTKMIRLPLTSDYVFKRIFAREENNSMLKDFLEAILNIHINKVEVKNPELPKDLIDKKAGILDIKAELNENQICDIEIPKFIKKNCGINTKLEQWLWLLTGKGEKVEMAEKENKEIKKQ